MIPNDTKVRVRYPEHWLTPGIREGFGVVMRRHPTVPRWCIVRFGTETTRKLPYSELIEVSVVELLGELA